MVTIGLLVWPGIKWGQEYKKGKNQKVTENALPAQTPFLSSPVNQILHVGSYPGYLSWFQVSLKSVEKCGSWGSRNFGLPIDLAHRLYNCLLLPHKPWNKKKYEQADPDLGMFIIFGRKCVPRKRAPHYATKVCRRAAWDFGLWVLFTLKCVLTFKDSLGAACLQL